MKIKVQVNITRPWRGSSSEVSPVTPRSEKRSYDHLVRSESGQFQSTCIGSWVVSLGTHATQQPTTSLVHSNSRISETAPVCRHSSSPCFCGKDEMACVGFCQKGGVTMDRSLGFLTTTSLKQSLVLRSPLQNAGASHNGTCLPRRMEIMMLFKRPRQSLSIRKVTNPIVSGAVDRPQFSLTRYIVHNTPRKKSPAGMSAAVADISCLTCA